MLFTFDAMTALHAMIGGCLNQYRLVADAGDNVVARPVALASHPKELLR